MAAGTLTALCFAESTVRSRWQQAVPQVQCSADLDLHVVSSARATRAVAAVIRQLNARLSCRESWHTLRTDGSKLHSPAQNPRVAFLCGTQFPSEEHSWRPSGGASSGHGLLTRRTLDLHSLGSQVIGLVRRLLNARVEKKLRNALRVSPTTAHGRICCTCEPPVGKQQPNITHSALAAH